MPLYEYHCRDCGHVFETVQKAGDPPKKKCPKCGGHLRKVITAPALQFKGKGWYVTDYSKKSGGRDPKDKGASESPKKSEEKKSDPSSSSKKD